MRTPYVFALFMFILSATGLASQTQMIRHQRLRHEHDGSRNLSTKDLGIFFKPGLTI